MRRLVSLAPTVLPTPFPRSLQELQISLLVLYSIRQPLTIRRCRSRGCRRGRGASHPTTQPFRHSPPTSPRNRGSISKNSGTPNMTCSGNPIINDIGQAHTLGYPSKTLIQIRRARNYAAMSTVAMAECFRHSATCYDTSVRRPALLRKARAHAAEQNLLAQRRGMHTCRMASARKGKTPTRVMTTVLYDCTIEPLMMHDGKVIDEGSRDKCDFLLFSCMIPRLLQNIDQVYRFRIISFALFSRRAAADFYRTSVVNRRQHMDTNDQARLSTSSDGGGSTIVEAAHVNSLSFAFFAPVSSPYFPCRCWGMGQCMR